MGNLFNRNIKKHSNHNNINKYEKSYIGDIIELSMIDMINQNKDNE
jgi:hypothetical protein